MGLRLRPCVHLIFVGAWIGGPGPGPWILEVWGPASHPWILRGGFEQPHPWIRRISDQAHGCVGCGASLSIPGSAEAVLVLGIGVLVGPASLGPLGCGASLPLDPWGVGLTSPHPWIHHRSDCGGGSERLTEQDLERGAPYLSVQRFRVVLEQTHLKRLVRAATSG